VRDGPVAEGQPFLLTLHVVADVRDCGGRDLRSATRVADGQGLAQ
jgi:hypothetical protein